MSVIRNLRVLATAVGVAALAPGPARADEPADLADLVRILHENQVIDDAEYSQMSSRAERRSSVNWWDRISLSGDFRARYEGSWFDKDKFGQEPNRHRARYRWRLEASAEVNEWADVVVRLASGNDDPRSTNQTLGSSLDFDKDPVVIDLAYIRLNPRPDGNLLGYDGSTVIEIGKVPNPFLWKFGNDFLLWDHDITLEGVSFQGEVGLTEAFTVFVNSGYYVIDENSSSKDPNVWGVQLGGHYQITSTFQVGGRTSFYNFRSLDMAFMGRGVDGTDGVTPSGGNIVDGLTGNSEGGRMSVIEGTAYLQCSCWEGWPVTLYGQIASNLDAENSVMFPTVNEEDLAWSLGLSLGDKQHVAQLGVEYAYMEANAFPSMYIDSDLFDGRTDRKGWAFLAVRQLLSNTDLAVSAFLSDAIQGGPAFEDGAANADRVRLRADLKVKF